MNELDFALSRRVEQLVKGLFEAPDLKLEGTVALDGVAAEPEDEREGSPEGEAAVFVSLRGERRELRL
jgi:hypothetical protein